MAKKDHEEYTKILKLEPEVGLNNEGRSVLRTVFEALNEKGYNPVRQLAYYLLSGEPAYITAHRNARALITTLERDELLEELVFHYMLKMFDDGGQAPDAE
jgi:uncharacterized protein (UPF0297 family)